MRVPLLPVSVIMVTALASSVFAQSASAPSATVPRQSAATQAGATDQAAAIRAELDRLRQEFQNLRQRCDHGQVFRGTSSVFNAWSHGDLMYLGHLRAYQDITEATNVGLGGSVAYGHNNAAANRAVGRGNAVRGAHRHAAGDRLDNGYRRFGPGRLSFVET